MKTISIIIPCYNEEHNIMPLYNSIKDVTATISNYKWELLFIDDGSQDNTLSILKQLNFKDNNCHYISFSRNFGKEESMLAVLDNAKGDCVVIMDADLQHPAEVIPMMINEWEDGYDDVYAYRESRGKESYIRKQLSLLYYKMLQKISKTDILPNVGDFRLLDRKCVDALKSMRETQRYTKGLYCWIGFKKKGVSFKQHDRINGKSSFNYFKLLNLAIEGITSYTVTPLKISTLLGIISSITSFIYMIYVFIKTILFGEEVQGFPTIIIIILFLGGIQLISLGIIGEYLGRIFNETKGRPNYIIREKQ